MWAFYIWFIQHVGMLSNFARLVVRIYISWISVSTIFQPYTCTGACANIIIKFKVRKKTGFAFRSKMLYKMLPLRGCIYCRYGVKLYPINQSIEIKNSLISFSWSMMRSSMDTLKPCAKPVHDCFLFWIKIT